MTTGLAYEPNRFAVTSPLYVVGRNSFIYFLIIPESTGGTGPMDVHVRTYIVAVHR